MTRSALSAATWKRLILTLALFTTSLLGLIAPVSQVKAITSPVLCAWNQNTIIVYYSDASRTHQVCQDILYPCYGAPSPNYCAGSHTFYTSSYCTSCGLN